MIPRNLLEDLGNALFKGKTILLYGPRQVGKTTLLKELLKKYPEKTAYFSCEDPFFRAELEGKGIEQLRKIIQGYTLVVFDEAQNLSNAGLVLKLLHDHIPEVQVIATGSSSFDLARKVYEPMTGRTRSFFLPPLSMEEIMKSGKNILEIMAQLEHFLRFGLYPGIFSLSTQDAPLFLKELATSYLFKDILSFSGIKHPDLLFHLLKALALQVGSEVSYHELAQLLKTDSATVERYIELLEKSFVVFRISAFSRNKRNEIAKSRKVYFWDLGVRNAIINAFEPLENRNDIGALFENFFIVERKKYLEAHHIPTDFFFWRNYEQKEIDLLEEREGKIFAFECKWQEKKAKGKLPKAFSAAYGDVPFSFVHQGNWWEWVTNMKK